MRHSVLLAVLLGACLPDPGGYVIVQDGGVGAIDAPGRDAPGRDSGGAGDGGPGRDGGGDDLCGLPVTCTDGCPLPWVLASIEDLPGGAECGGRVARFAVLPDESTCSCGMLAADDPIPRLAFTIGFVPPSTVVVASEDDQVVGIDATSDRLVWSAPSRDQPGDVFPLAEPAVGPAHAAVAYRPRGSTQLRRLDLHATDDGRLVRSFDLSAVEAFGISGATLSPWSRTSLRAVKPNGGYAAADIDPWIPNLVGPPYHTASRESFFLQRIDSFFWDGTYRVVWTGERSDLSGPERHRVWSYRRTIREDDNRVPLGSNCRNTPDDRAFDLECTFPHAVGHPYDDTGMFALCEQGARTRIVRMETFDNVCHDVLDTSELFPSARISDIAIALDDYWDE